MEDVREKVVVVMVVITVVIMVVYNGGGGGRDNVGRVVERTGKNKGE